MTLPPDLSSTKSFVSWPLLRQMTSFSYRFSQSPRLETMRPYVRELCEGMYDRMQDGIRSHPGTLMNPSNPLRLILMHIAPNKMKPSTFFRQQTRIPANDLPILVAPRVAVIRSRCPPAVSEDIPTRAISMASNGRLKACHACGWWGGADQCGQSS